MPIIGRYLPSDRLGKHSSKVLVLAMILIAVLVLGATAGLLGQIGNSKEPLPSETPVRTPARIAYTMHSPISIIGNGGFTNASGVVWGSGTESDPYIIEGLDINASTANGIEIQNTDAHFIVRGCHVHDGGGDYYGIRLGDCANGTLENNNCTNNVVGIGLYLSSNNTLSKNNCSNNADDGMCLVNSNDNTLSNNNCSNNRDGMYLVYSNDNTISSNNCSSNYLDGMYLVYSNDNTLSNNTCNSNYLRGIAAYSTSNNTLNNNTCSSNSVFGIYLGPSSNTLSGNLICSNGNYGVYATAESVNCRINNNTFVGNNGAGSVYNPSHVQASDDGTSNSWNSTDGYGNYWSDWTTPDVAPPDGIVDVPYDIAGSAGAKDYYPLTTAPTEPIPEFGVMPIVVMVFLAAVLLTREARRRKAQ